MLAGCLALTLSALGTLHLYWSLGGSRYRRFATPAIDGGPTVRPSSAAFATVVGLLCLGALIAVSMATVRDIHGTDSTWAWNLSILFGCRALGDFRLIGLFCKRVDAEHRKVERGLVVPICIFLSLGFARLSYAYPG